MLQTELKAEREEIANLTSQLDQLKEKNCE